MRNGCHNQPDRADEDRVVLRESVGEVLLAPMQDPIRPLQRLLTQKHRKRKMGPNAKLRVMIKGGSITFGKKLPTNREKDDSRNNNVRER